MRAWGSLTQPWAAISKPMTPVAIVRLHCQQEDFVSACDVVEKSNSAAAAFMLARQLEATEQVYFILYVCPSVWLL